MAKSYKNFSYQLKEYVNDFNREPKMKKSKKVRHFIDDIDVSDSYQTEEFDRKQQAKMKKNLM